MSSGWASYPSLKGRSVLVTGGGSGIGAQIVRRFCEQGSKVAFLDVDAACSEELVGSYPNTRLHDVMRQALLG